MSLEQAQKSNDEVLRSFANQVEELQVLQESGHITDEEFKELVEDIKRTLELEEKCSDMQTKSNLIKAIDIILKIV